MMTWTDGSQLRDIAFISQAIVGCRLAPEESDLAGCMKALERLN